MRLVIIVSLVKNPGTVMVVGTEMLVAVSTIISRETNITVTGSPLESKYTRVVGIFTRQEYTKAEDFGTHNFSQPDGRGTYLDFVRPDPQRFERQD